MDEQGQSSRVASGGRGASGAADSPSTVSLHLLVSLLPEWVEEAV